MGGRSYPPLTPGEVVSILVRLGFIEVRCDGSHRQFEKAATSTMTRRLVTVDASVSSFGIDLMKSMIRQSGYARETFYGATKKTKKKI